MSARRHKARATKAQSRRLDRWYWRLPPRFRPLVDRAIASLARQIDDNIMAISA